jgi:GNAT superfamily N-acetyltransferase
VIICVLFSGEKMKNIKMRDAHNTDRDIIQSVTLSAYEQYAAVMGEMWKFYRENILATLADVKPTEQIVAETQDGIVGTVLLYPTGTQVHAPDGTSVTMQLPEIRLLAVAPQARGQGIGQALVQECLRRARQSGATAITLHTTEMMSVAMKMYEQMGFVHNPSMDFSPAPGRIVKGYRFDFDITNS